jgi:hypothetical protein
MVGVQKGEDPKHVSRNAFARYRTAVAVHARSWGNHMQMVA